MSDYYQMLGVAPSASAAEIRRAYALLAREKHPDRFRDPAEKQRAEAAFQQITAAFNTLMNPGSRKEYDEARHRPQPRTPEEVATDAFERGQAALEAGQVEEAITLLQTAVLGSPRITEAEIESISAMKNVSDQILREIGNHREWTKRYTVLNNLVRNPRTPIGIALSMVSRLNPRDVKSIAVDRNVPEPVRKQAQKFVKAPQQPR